MKVKSISYIKAFNVTGFLNDKVGIEIELSEGESEDAAFELAVKKTNEWANKVVRAVDAAANFREPINVSGYSITTPIIPSMRDLSVEAIMSCTDLKILEIYEPLIDKTKDQELKRKLFMAYDEKFKELNAWSEPKLIPKEDTQ